MQIHNSRLNNLRKIIKENNLDAMLVSMLDNVFYLSGFGGDAGWLMVSADKTLLAVDFRFIEQAKVESGSLVEIVHIKGDLESWFPGLISDYGFKNIGFESGNLTFSQFVKLQDIAKKLTEKTKLMPQNNLVESLRAIKDNYELNYIRKAAQLADESIEFARTRLEDQITELELAWEIERFLRENGSEKMPFDVIVASGTNSAMPHAKNTHKEIKSNEPILIDLGAKVNNYCSDLSRTLYFGKFDETFTKIYDIVLGAQLTAMSMIESNMSGKQADSFARTVIEQAKYGEYFGHALGHGIGLAIHENPLLSQRSEDILINNMVFSIEPGIYLPGWGGVRIEDTVVLENGRVTSLNKSQKLLNFS
jgi:Xaa-Pro aminopeptidase